jgi:signal transduction histidine kinase
MPLDNAERLYLERQVTLARPISIALALIILLAVPGAHEGRAPAVFLFVYLLISIGAALIEGFFPNIPYRMHFVVDLLALAVFVFLTPSIPAFWFVYLFVVFELAIRGDKRPVLLLVGAATLGVLLRFAVVDSFHWQSTWRLVAIGLGTLVSGLAMEFLGGREQEHIARQQFLVKLMGLLQFDRGLAESIRQVLGELALRFDCQQACLVVLDDELERLFVWKVRADNRDMDGPETLPLARSETFLVDCLEISMCWEFVDGKGRGFGWDRRTGERFRELPHPPQSTREEFGTKSLLAVTIELGGRPAGRVLLINPFGPHESPRRFSAADLRRLEFTVRHIGPPLENIYLLRHLRARAIESERSRISRDLHDGVLQTLLSLKIQLEVLRRNLQKRSIEQAGTELASLQKTVQQEGDDLRRMVTDLRPLRVESADMHELMFSFAERFRNESGLAVDLFIEDPNLRLPDRICRELFQIYREALHNVKKHANASHVVVKLGQDEAKVRLVVDDNGLGFSFSGKYASEELNQLRLGPISIKERTRSVGGTLTVESNPGHGARLTIEIPLN